MPGTQHRDMLAELTALYRAYCEANWHPREPPPLAVRRWLSVTPLLLRHYLSRIEELEALEELQNGRQ